MKRLATGRRLPVHLLLARCLSLSLVSFATTACEHVPRSAYRKLAVYDPQRLQSLDIMNMRLALRHDSRTPLELESTHIYFVGGFEDWTRELCRFVPSLLSDSADPPGLPPAGKGMTWTVLAVRKEDSALAKRVSQLSWRYLEVTKKWTDFSAARRQEESELLVSNLSTVFPRFLLGDYGSLAGRPRVFEFSPHYQLRLSPVPAGEENPHRVDIWVLLDPKDGYFQFAKGVPPLGLADSSGSRGE